MTGELEFYARCPLGLEDVLASELKNLKLQRIRPLKGGVAFFGTLKDGYRACLWTRSASRILVILSRFSCKDDAELYRGVQSINWADHLSSSSTLSVHVRGTNDFLRNTQYSAMKAKDAVCDLLRDKTGERPSVSNSRPDVLIDITIREHKATLSLDLSGESLHIRGYRIAGKQTEAPLKEALAAGILLKCGWSVSFVDAVFCDPLCGSGTFAIEAAMICSDKAPGLMRDYWGFLGWKKHEQDIWNSLLDEADERFEKGLRRMPLIIACDNDSAALHLARNNALRAGFKDSIMFVEDSVDHLQHVLKETLRDIPFPSYGLVVMNPPYGKRLMGTGQLPALYAAISEGLSKLPHSWEIGIFSSDEHIDEHMGLFATSVDKLYNGKIETNLRHYVIEETNRHTFSCPRLSDGKEISCSVLLPSSEQFAARLRKVAKQKRKWAQKNQVSCYRLYDADLPDYSAAIDIYHDLTHGEEYVYLSEYEAPLTIDPLKAQQRLNDMVGIVPSLLGIPSDQVFVKHRRKDKGGSQYFQEERKSFQRIIQESGLKFEVDFEGYLDTGIFLDHRLTRQLIREIAQGESFLNLFAYTGTATVYAASGGAQSTTTVDLSQTYLDWAKRNMKLNGFQGDRHHYIKSDVLQWITEERRSNRRYDLIFVDPPTFSNSKSMGKKTWSVQRDHAELLIGVSRLLSEHGKAIFSCNYRGFKPDSDYLKKYGVALEDITDETIPFDFERNKKIHKCYIVTRFDTCSAHFE